MYLLQRVDLPDDKSRALSQCSGLPNSGSLEILAPHDTCSKHDQPIVRDTSGLSRSFAAVRAVGNVVRHNLDIRTVGMADKNDSRRRNNTTSSTSLRSRSNETSWKPNKLEL